MFAFTMDEATNENQGAVLTTITTNAHGWFQAVSPQFLELIGQPVEALAGVNLLDLVHPLQTAAVRSMLARCEPGSADRWPTANQPVRTRLFAADDRWIAVVVAIDQVVDGGVTLSLSAVTEPEAETSVRPGSGGSAAAHFEPAISNVAPAVTSAMAVDRGEHIAAAPVVAAPVLSAATTATSLPATPAGVDEDFPYDDSDAHTAYVAMMPADTIPELRDAVRESIGDRTTPMLEIDIDGRTTFVQGAWSELSADGAGGADVFEDLLAQSERADEILGGLATVFETGQPCDFELGVAGLAPRWVRLLPIPSPHLAGVVHVLAAVVTDSQLTDATTVPVDPPSPK